MVSSQRIQSLDILTLARSAHVIEGQTPLAEMARVQSACADLSPQLVNWRLQCLLKPGPDGRDQPWLMLRVDAGLPLTCVRCLHPVLQALCVERTFRFVADEDTAQAEDEDSEEDLLPLTPPLNGLHLIEDELLMAMPMLPNHDFCNSEYLQTNDVDPSEAAPKPFAMLAQWRKPEAKGD